MDIIATLEAASAALSKANAIEMVIADIDGLCGHGMPYVSGGKNGGYSDPTYQAFQRLSDLREQLRKANEKGAARVMLMKDRLFPQWCCV
jgi:hypothetical protein